MRENIRKQQDKLMWAESVNQVSYTEEFTCIEFRNSEAKILLCSWEIKIK
jgi:hypothetical protein